MNSLEPSRRWPGLDMDRLPRHIAIIMDGNGRWAKKRAMNRLKGHHEGSESVREIVRTCREMGVQALTLYAFSTENWDRPETEVKGLMELLRRFLKSEKQEMIDTGIRLTTIGQTDRLPKSTGKILREVMAATAGGKDMVLNLALSYGSRAEMVGAVQGIARRVAAGELNPDEIDENLIGAGLQTADLPEVDLIIRTSGEARLSNFLLWQAAYAEIIFTPTLWPDFRADQLAEAIADFQKRERRFGKTSEQVAAG